MAGISPGLSKSDHCQRTRPPSWNHIPHVEDVDKQSKRNSQLTESPKHLLSGFSNKTGPQKNGAMDVKIQNDWKSARKSTRALLQSSAFLSACSDWWVKFFAPSYKRQLSEHRTALSVNAPPVVRQCGSWKQFQNGFSLFKANTKLINTTNMVQAHMNRPNLFILSPCPLSCSKSSVSLESVLHNYNSPTSNDFQQNITVTRR